MHLKLHITCTVLSRGQKCLNWIPCPFINRRSNPVSGWNILLKGNRSMSLLCKEHTVSEIQMNLGMERCSCTMQCLGKGSLAGLAPNTHPRFHFLCAHIRIFLGKIWELLDKQAQGWMLYTVKFKADQGLQSTVSCARN